MLVSVGGVRLNVLDFAPDRPADPPIVFLHGMGGQATNWLVQLVPFSARHRVLAIDARGFGASDRTYGAVTLVDYGEDVRRVLHVLGVERPVLVGMSMGGMIAQAVAIGDPMGISGLVLASTSCHADRAMAQQTISAGMAAAQNGMGAILADVVPACFAPSTVADRAPCVAEFERSFSSTDPLTFLIASKALAQLDFTDALPRVNVPTLVIRGDHDQLITPDHGDVIVSLLPKAELQTIYDSGHLNNMERPDAFNALLARFVSRLAI